LTKKPLVSVIIPSYKRTTTLGRAIESVLNQTYKNIEIIIVDDNDEYSEYREETKKFMQPYIANYNIKYLKHKTNKNGAAARNTGIKNANGDYIAFLDDDDEFAPNKIELQISKISKLDDRWGGVYTGYICKNKNKIVMESGHLTEGNFKEELLMMKAGIGSGSTLLFKKKVLDELNGFNETFKRHQDWELLIRFFRKYKMGAVDKKLTIIHKDDSNNRPKAKTLEELKYKYLSCFEQDIITYPTNIQHEIYKCHFLEVSRAYFKEKKIQRGYDFYKRAISNSNSSIREKLIVILSIIDGFVPIKDKLKSTINQMPNNYKNRYI